MTKKDFFRIVIKLMGIYLLVNLVFQSIPGFLAMGVTGSEFSGVLLLLVGITIMAFLYYCLIFLVDRIIDWLKLDKGFDTDTIQLGTLKQAEILNLGVIIIGGLLLINHIPSFLSSTFLVF